ncbi:MAG: transposase [Frankiaceae bacterium]
MALRSPRSTRLAVTTPCRPPALPDAVQVLDAFHCVKLANQVVDEDRRRVQQATQGHRGHENGRALPGPPAAAPGPNISATPSGSGWAPPSWSEIPTVSWPFLGSAQTCARSSRKTPR